MSAQPRYHSGCCWRVKGIIANHQVEYALMCTPLTKQQEPVSITACVSPSIGWVNSMTGTLPVGTVHFYSKTLPLRVGPSPAGFVSRLKFHVKLTWVSRCLGSGKCGSHAETSWRAGIFSPVVIFTDLLNWFADDIRHIMRYSYSAKLPELQTCVEIINTSQISVPSFHMIPFWNILFRVSTPFIHFSIEFIFNFILTKCFNGLNSFIIKCRIF